jgi:hypothetical protein
VENKTFTDVLEAIEKRVKGNNYHIYSTTYDKIYKKMDVYHNIEVWRNQSLFSQEGSSRLKSQFYPTKNRLE